MSDLMTSGLTSPYSEMEQFEVLIYQCDLLPYDPAMPVFLPYLPAHHFSCSLSRASKYSPQDVVFALRS